MPSASTCATYALVQGEAMVDASWQRDQVPLAHGNADPPVLLVPDIKVGLAVQDVADLIVDMQVLLKEHVQLRDKRNSEAYILLLSSQLETLAVINKILQSEVTTCEFPFLQFQQREHTSLTRWLLIKIEKDIFCCPT